MDGQGTMVLLPCVVARDASRGNCQRHLQVATTWQGNLRRAKAKEEMQKKRFMNACIPFVCSRSGVPDAADARQGHTGVIHLKLHRQLLVSRGVGEYNLLAVEAD